MKKLAKLLIGLLLLALLIYLAGPGKVLEGLVRLGPVTFFFALLLYFAGQFTCAVKWRLISGALDMERSVFVHVALYLSGMFMNLFLPTAVGGDVGRAYLLGGKERWQAGLASVIAERYTGMVVLSFLLALGALKSSGFLPGKARYAFLLLFPITVAIPFLYARLGLEVKKKLLGDRFEVFDKLGELMYRGKVVAVSLALSLVFYIFYIFLHYLIIYRLWGPVNLWDLVVIVTATSVVSMIPVSLGGLGLREGSYLFFLSLIGVPSHTGVAFGVSVLAVNLTLSFAGGFLLFLGKNIGKI